LRKLVFVTRNMKAGGAERVIAQLANIFCAGGIETVIATLDSEEVFYKLDERIRLIAIGRQSGSAYVDKYKRYRELRKYIISEKPDLVLAMPEEIGIFVIPALLGTGIPVVVSERNNPYVMPWKKETRLMRKLFYPFAAGFIFQTKQAAGFFSKKIQSRGIVLPNPLDLSRIPEPYKGERRRVVVGAGRLDRQKNFPLLIKAFAQFYKDYPDYTLTIYGEGTLREELEALAASLLPKDAYRLPGNTTELLERIKDAAMFVLSSDYEGMPNVVIEAMAAGLPVIATDCPAGGPAELIDNGENGLLVPVGDVDKLCLAMQRVAADEALAEKIGHNAIDIKKRLDSKVIAEQWREYLEQCCGT